MVIFEVSMVRVRVSSTTLGRRTPATDDVRVTTQVTQEAYPRHTPWRKADHGSRYKSPQVATRHRLDEDI